jgi:hypothetical protein
MAAGTNNPALALMTVLGRCGDLSANTFIVLNEITTVAAANTLAPFATSPSAIGSSASDSANLASAFVAATQFANTSTGSFAGAPVPAGTAVPVALINTTANILSSCVNSAGGVAGDPSNCGVLFSSVTPIGTNPAGDTISAAFRILTNPTLNTADLFNRMPAAPPFQPTLVSAPSSFSTSLLVNSGLQASAGSLAFSTSVVGSSSTRTLTLTNTSQNPIAPSLFTISGINEADFALTNNCPGSLSAGASCQASLTFTPAATGNRVASLYVANDSPQLSVDRRTLRKCYSAGAQPADCLGLAEHPNRGIADHACDDNRHRFYPYLDRPGERFDPADNLYLISVTWLQSKFPIHFKSR